MIGKKVGSGTGGGKKSEKEKGEWVGTTRIDPWLSWAGPSEGKDLVCRTYNKVFYVPHLDEYITVPVEDCGGKLKMDESIRRWLIKNRAKEVGE